ncbi:MAG: hypothetical protein H7A20_10325 [Rhodanobacteraceae bacterium]|nr:hypothetical protein [Xanthomonadales bacterium]MCP5479158.1 hypothetical protein [Rhodanobacteraceae bacterium]HPF72156.1 hypothetical protein [Xanthomonadaceae bacterium]HRX99373.1 hypothetical protein [Xanthomonadaceae bacterium]
MKSLSRNLLMGAILAALPMSGALACTVSQWTGAKTAVDADAKLPAEVGTYNSRYSGSCGLVLGSSGDYVGDNHPANDSTYNARFYVFPELSGGSAEVFGAYTADDGGGSQPISISYGSGQFTFNVGGASGNVAAAAGKWYSIEFAYDAAADTFSATVGNSTFSGSTVGVALTNVSLSGTIGDVAAIESARLGWIASAGTGRIIVDEFESTRGVAIGRLRPGDANGDADCSVADYNFVRDDIAAKLELFFGGSNTTALAAGQPDCNEGGQTDVADYTCLANRIGTDLNNQFDGIPGNETECAEAL